MSKAGTADGVKGDDARKAPAPAGVSPEGRRRGPKPSMSLPMIAAAALEIADDDGLDNVSMPRLARRLGVSTMALYRYVADKSALVDAQIEMAAARPVVATDVGGVRHVVADGETGWLCQPRGPAALAQLVQRAFERPDLSAAMAAEGR
ncbi:MAG TPA: TetR/AcrR family transcriptional regulator [Acidimicrobiales bacterium]|nr:TetR/AcrR family transcriptional regulator [Acidimicrobiales bacterium]